MKKLCILLAAALMAASLAACGGSSSSMAPSPTPDAASSQPATTETGGEPGMEEPGAEQPAEPDADLTKLLDGMYAAQDPGLGLMTTAIDLNDATWLKYYTGMERADGVDAAIASEAMISAQAYSVILLRAAEGTDAAALAEQLLNSVDPMKWICAQADDVRAVASGSYAMVAMLDSAYADSITSEQLAAAFLQAVGGEASYEATRELAPGEVPEGAVGVG